MRILAQFGSIYNTLVCSLLIFSKFTGEEHYMTMITLKTMPYLIKHMLITGQFLIVNLFSQMEIIYIYI